MIVNGQYNVVTAFGDLVMNASTVEAVCFCVVVFAASVLFPKLLK